MTRSGGIEHIDGDTGHTGKAVAAYNKVAVIRASSFRTQVVTEGDAHLI